MIPVSVSTMIASLRAMLVSDDHRDGERGQGLVEYGLIVILVAVVVIVVVALVGHQANNVFSNVSKGLSS